MDIKGQINSHILVSEVTDYSADTGTANAYAVTLGIKDYVEGLQVSFKAANPNTTSSTLKVDSLTAKSIKKNSSSNLVAGDILTGQIVTVIYDGTYFQFVAGVQDLKADVKFKQTEIDFGVSGVYDATFTITDTDVGTTSIITGQMSYDAGTGKDADEMEFDSFSLQFAAGAGQFTLRAISNEGLVADKFKVNYSYNKT